MLAKRRKYGQNTLTASGKGRTLRLSTKYVGAPKLCRRKRFVTLADFSVRIGGNMEIVICVLSAILGLCVGSFLNVVIYRVPLGMSIAMPPSHCPKCGYRLKWYDNIPVLSYVILGGKCRSCKQPIGVRYTLVELLNMLLWLLCALSFADNIFYLVVCCLVCSTLVAVTFIDLEHMLIFDRFQIILAVLGVAAIFADPSVVWWGRLVGGAAGDLLFFAFYGVAYLIYRKEGLGFGDVILAAVCGLFLGWQRLIVMVLVASLTGSIILLILKAVRKDEAQREYPFAPFIALGTIVAMLCGDALINWYLALCGLA